MENFKDTVRIIKSIIFLILAIYIIAVVQRHFFSSNSKEKEATTIETSSKLQKVLQISELSTYHVTFNGVAAVKDAENKLLYNVAYQAKVGIGLDMEQIRVDIDQPDESQKKIIVTLPEIKIADVTIDPGSLDYIFEDASADTEDISITSLPACKADAETDCMSNDIIFELAEENAVNTVKALMQPFLAQNEGYTLKIQVKGGSSYEG